MKGKISGEVLRGEKARHGNLITCNFTTVQIHQNSVGATSSNHPLWWEERQKNKRKLAAKWRAGEVCRLYRNH